LLYTPGHLDLLFNKIEFLKSVAHGIIASFILFFIPYGAFKNSVGPEGINLDGHQIFGTVVSTILVLVVTAQVSHPIIIEYFIATVKPVYNKHVGASESFR
jgi:phospholipid-translocating ATPase